MAIALGSFVVAAGETGFFDITGLPFRPNQLTGRYQTEAPTTETDRSDSIAFVATDLQEGCIASGLNFAGTVVQAADQMVKLRTAAGNEAIGTFQAFTNDGWMFHLSTNTLTFGLRFNYAALRS